MINARLELWWNGTPVLRADCTRTVAYSILADFAGNFANVSKAAERQPAFPTLDSIVAAAVGVRFENTWNDGYPDRNGRRSPSTGRARFVLDINGPMPATGVAA